MVKRTVERWAVKKKEKIYLTPPNPICDLCDHLLFGMVKIADMAFYACRESNCEFVESEMETEFTTAEGEAVIIRKLKKTKKRQEVTRERGREV